MIYYVLGFLFSEDKKRVCLILKTKPDFLVGKHNGVGGKMESNEDHDKAIEREFKEETGLLIPANKWDYAALLKSEKWLMHVFRVFSDIALANVKTAEEEVIGVYEVAKMNEMNIVSNLPWLVPFLLDKNSKFMTADVK
jgi:ADP-ribose pyrophosphatase YjhB (NUDIX family)